MLLNEGKLLLIVLSLTIVEILSCETTTVI